MPNKHPRNIGKPRLLQEPSELWDLFVKYRDSVKKEAEKWATIQFVGKNGRAEKVIPNLPMTIDGFHVFCYDNIGIVEPYWYNRDNNYAEYLPIVSRIKKEIRDCQIKGALVGQYNPNLTARLNGLGDKQQIEKQKIVVKKPE